MLSLISVDLLYLWLLQTSCVPGYCRTSVLLVIVYLLGGSQAVVFGRVLGLAQIWEVGQKEGGAWGVGSTYAWLCRYASWPGYLGKILTCLLGHSGLPGKHTGYSV